MSARPRESLELPLKQPIATDAPRERVVPTIGDVTFFHIDDKLEEHEKRFVGLEKLGIDPSRQLGTAQSADGAIAQLQTLADQNQAPGFILLDQQFFRREGDKVIDVDAARRFVTKYASLMKEPKFAEAFAHTKIIVVSATDDDAYMKMLKELCSSVIGRAPKQNDVADDTSIVTDYLIIDILANAGAIQEDELVKESRQKLVPHRFNEALQKMSQSDYSALVEAKGERILNSVILFLAMVDNYRAQAGLPPLSINGSTFTKILESLTLGNRRVSPDLLLATEE